MADDAAFHAAMEKVGTELTYVTAWEDLTIDEIIRVALEAARPIIEAEVRAADLAAGQEAVAAGDERVAEYMRGAAGRTEPGDG